MKNCWIIVGPESSGSVLIAKTLSYAVGHCEKYGDYSGYGYNDELGVENLVLHRSIPYKRPKLFQAELTAELEKFTDQYENVNYILTSRDKNCSIQSKMSRFKDTFEQAENDYLEAAPFFEQLVRDPKCFIWSYESMNLYQGAYFARLYNFFGIDSEFYPDVYDGNARYVKKSSLLNIRNRLAQAVKSTIGK